MPDPTNTQDGLELSELDVELSFASPAGATNPATKEEMQARTLALAGRLGAIVSGSHECPAVVLNALITLYLTCGETYGLQSECASLLLTTGFTTALKSAPASVLGGQVH